MGDEYLIIESNGDWTITGTNDWCSVEKSTGTGNDRVKVTVTAHSGFTERSVELAVKQESLSKAVKVTQLATPYQLDIDRESITFEADGDNQLVDGIRINGFKITSNGDWVITGTNDWCSVAKTSGTGEALIEVIAKENTTGVDRSIKLTITAGNVTKLLTINQKGISFNVFDAITDVNFRNYCKVFDTNKNGVLSIIEAKEVKTILASGFSINSLAGIEYFTELLTLGCSQNNIEDLNLIKNTRLVNVSAHLNPIKKVDVSQCKDLEYLRIGDTASKLDKLDISKNTQLKSLRCSNMELGGLDVSKNPKLYTLICENTQISILDVSNNLQLDLLYCLNNKITHLDITKNIKLTMLDCSNNKLSTLDVSKNIELLLLECSSNLLTSLDISKNMWLEILTCKGNPNLNTILVSSAFDPQSMSIDKDSFTVFK